MESRKLEIGEEVMPGDYFIRGGEKVIITQHTIDMLESNMSILKITATSQEVFRYEDKIQSN